MVEQGRGRPLAVVATVALAGALAGCGTVPSTGAVRYGRSVNQGAGGLDDSDIHVLPPAPGPGQSPEGVVEGFLRASANFDDDHAIARRYLTAAAARDWDPDAGITVYTADPARRTVSAVAGTGSERTVVLHASRVATIAPDGAYTVSPGIIDQPLVLARSGADWRLARVPPGLLLTPTDVQRDLRSVFTYFLDAGQAVVVPDHVFLRTPARGRPTALLRALLDGPTRWLAPAVTTAFPPGTKLIGNAPLDGTVVVVNLSPEAGRAGPAARAAMSAQLVWTLRQLPDITGVRIQVEGSAFGVPGAGDVQRISDWASFDPDPARPPPAYYFMANGSLRTDSGAPAPGPLGRGALPLTSPAVGGEVVAGLRTTATSTSLYAGPRAGLPTPRLAAARGGLTPPSVDGSGAVWTVRAGSPVAVLRIAPGGARAAGVPADALLRFGPVLELQISRDGTRAAAIVRTGTASRLLVGRVVPDRLGSPALEGFRAVTVGLQGPSSVSWADSHRVAVLARTAPAGASSPWLVEADGSLATSVATTGLPAGGPDRLAAGPDDVLIVAAAGGIYRSTGGSWTSIAAGTDPTWAR